MCIGQVGNLLPHVTPSVNLAQHLMPTLGFSAAEGGMMALEANMQVKAVTYCHDTYRVTTGDGKRHAFGSAIYA